MSENAFRQSIRNASLRIKGDILAGHVHEANAKAIKEELGALSGKGNVRGMARQGFGSESPKPLKVGPRGEKDLAPAEKASVYADICAATLDGLYSAVKEWSGMTTIIGAAVAPPSLIAGPGCLRPHDLNVKIWVTVKAVELPDWARAFALKAAGFVNDGFRMWAGSFAPMGIPVFPQLIGSTTPAAGQPGIPIMVGQITQNTGALTPGTLGALMMGLSNAGVPGHEVEAQACGYIARTFCEIWSFSLAISRMHGLIAVGGAAGGIGANVVAPPGILREIGDNLPNPRAILPGSGIAGSSIQAALRADMKAAADRAVNAPTAPPVPPAR